MQSLDKKLRNEQKKLNKDLGRSNGGKPNNNRSSGSEINRLNEKPKSKLSQKSGKMVELENELASMRSHVQQLEERVNNAEAQNKQIQKSARENTTASNQGDMQKDALYKTASSLHHTKNNSLDQ